MARICLIKGQSQYDVMRLFADLLADELRRMDHAVALLDMATPDWPQRAGEVFAQPTDMVISFNAVGIDLKVDEGSLYERLGICFVAVLMDHPLHHLERLHVAPPGSLFVCVDESHARFIEWQFRGTRAAAFLPHPGMVAPGPVVRARDKEFDLVFSGTYTDPDAIRAGWAPLPASIRGLFEDIAHALLAGEDVVLHEATDRVLASHGLHLEHAQRAAFSGELRGVDHYVRAVRRRDGVRRLAAAGLRFDLFGANWERADLGDRPNVRIHPAAALSDALVAMKRSRLTLNIMPAFPRGAHDRIFSAMLNGSVAVSDTNGYIASLFEDGCDGVFFRWSKLDELPDRLGALLADPDRIDAMAARGREQCIGRHDWSARARRLIALIEAHRILHSLAHPPA